MPQHRLDTHTRGLLPGMEAMEAILPIHEQLILGWILGWIPGWIPG
jgi:hypothetical protein